MPPEKPKGLNINIFLPDGVPEGLKIVHRINWSGVAVACSRSQYLKARARPEFEGTGVYVLFDHSEADADLPRVYVGETDVLRARLDEHLKQKEWWNHLVAFTSLQGHLNKAHAKNVEAQLVALAKAAKRCKLENGNAPPAPQLSEAERENFRTFLYEMLVILPLLGATAFEVPPVEGQPGAEASPELFIKRPDLVARGREVDQGFVVYAKSQARPTKETSQTASSLKKTKELLGNGILVPQGAGFLFSQDYLFSSPSQAAEVVLGSAQNGRTEWKTDGGTTLKQLQEAVLDSQPG